MTYAPRPAFPLSGLLQKAVDQYSTAGEPLEGVAVEINNGKPVIIDQPDAQLVAVRRQVTQLEGLLESNNQRELRVAGEREAALRLEMADIRQDLRVALETLYRMPESQAVVSDNGDLDALRKQVAGIEAAFTRASQQQERAALEREASLKAELGHVRRDLLVTLEASYQMPGDKADGLHTQIAAWHGEVEALQRLITGYQKTQEERTLQTQAENRKAMSALQAQLDGSIVSLEARIQESEAAFRGTLRHDLDAHLEKYSVASLDRIRAIETSMVTGSTSLDQQITALRDDLGVGLASQLGSSETLDGRLTEMQTALASEMQRVSGLTEERYNHISDEVETKLSHLAATLDTLRTSPADEGRMVLELGNLQAVSAQLSEGLHELQSDFLSTVEEMRWLHADERRFAAENIDALRSQFTESHHLLLAAMSERADGASQAAPLTADTVSDVVAEQMSSLRSQLVKVQSEQYHQLIAQMAQLQADLDTVNTGMYGLQPLTDTDDVGNAVLGEQINHILMALETRPADTTAASAEVVDHLREELAGLRSDLQAGLGTLADRPEPREDLERLMSSFMAESNAGREEFERQSAGANSILQAEVLRLRQEIEPVLQHISAAEQSDTIGDASAALRAELTDLRSHVSGLWTQQRADTQRVMAQMREDVQAWHLVQSAVTSAEPGDLGAAQAAYEMMHAATIALTERYDRQQRTLEERDDGIRHEFHVLREQFARAISANDVRENRPDEEAMKDHHDAVQRELHDLREQFMLAIAESEQSRVAQQERVLAERDAGLRRELLEMRDRFLEAIAGSEQSRSVQQAVLEARRVDQGQIELHELRDQFMEAISVTEQSRYEQQEKLLEKRDNGIRQELNELREQFLQAVAEGDQSRKAENLRLLHDHNDGIRHELSELREQLTKVVTATEQAGANADRVSWQEELAHLRLEIASVAERSIQVDSTENGLIASEVSTLRSEVSAALHDLRNLAARPDEPSRPEGEPTSGVFTVIAATLRETTERQEQVAAAQGASLNLAIAQVREEMRAVINGLSRESIDTYEKRQTQLRMDQLEMERDLAKLRQELVSTQGDLNGKKKGWR